MNKYKLDFKVDYILENEFVSLSPFKLEHSSELKSISKDVEIWTYFLEKGIGNKKWKEYCLGAIHNRTINKEYPFVIYDKKNNQYVGMTRLYDFDETLQVIKMGHTWIAKKYWGTKLNKHCKYLLFKFIFEDLELERVGFGVHGQNLRSVHALKSVGCLQEGVLRNFLPSITNDSRTDLFLFSLLRKDWTANVKAKLESKLS